MDNFSTGFRHNLAAVADRIEIFEGDVADSASAAQAVKGVDCVIHQAALASVPLSVERPLDVHAACATGTLVMLDAARRAGVKRFVYAASSSAYGDQPGDQKTETDLPSVLSPYAAAKLTGEYYCQAFYYSYGLETVALRYFNVFGPRQDPASPYSAVIPLFVTAIVAGKQPVIFGDGGQTRDFVYVENVAQANLLAAEAKGVGGQSFNIGNGQSTSLLELMEMLNELLGTNVTPSHRPPRAATCDTVRPIFPALENI